MKFSVSVFLIVLVNLIPTYPGALIKPREIKVMVIDTGVYEHPRIAPYIATQNVTDELRDSHGHGTHVTGLILFGPSLNQPVCSEVKIYSCKYMLPEVHSTDECLHRAKTMKMDIVNYSGGGVIPIKEEAEAVEALGNIPLVAAAGNLQMTADGVILHPALDLTVTPYYPASLPYKNVIPVGNGTSSEDRAPSSNYGLSNMRWREGRRIESYTPFGNATMTGSSQSAAIYTHEWLMRKCHLVRSAR